MADASVSAPSAINLEDFIRILVAQLSYQDPLKPMDSQAFVSQLAQFTSLQQTQEINDKIGNILSIQGSMQSIGLLGKTVDINVSDGSQTGRVTALAFQSGEPRLTITLTSGAILADVSMANVISIR